jgi:hypothetical protein
MSLELQAAWGHLLRLSDSTGSFEHASGATPRRNHGYCVDDVARGLVVLAREAHLSPQLQRLSERYLAFVSHAQIHTRAVHNRLGFDRRWHDAAGSGDWWGRAVWGLGTVAGRSRHSWLRDESLSRFEISASHRSPSRRSGGVMTPAGGRRTLPMPRLVSTRAAAAVYGFAALDSRGRIADRAVIGSLGWLPGTRVDIHETQGLIVIAAEPRGVFSVTGQGHVRLPAAVRHWCGLAAGDRVLLVAEPADGLLVVHPPASLDAMVARAHAAVLGGDVG